jgi:hypothetical protein
MKIFLSKISEDKCWCPIEAKSFGWYQNECRRDADTYDHGKIKFNFKKSKNLGVYTRISSFCDWIKEKTKCI